MHVWAYRDAFCNRLMNGVMRCPLKRLSRRLTQRQMELARKQSDYSKGILPDVEWKVRVRG